MLMGGLSSIGGAIGGAFGGPVGAGIGLGVGSLFEESSARGQTRSQQRHQDEREDTRYQRAVTDAKAAGLHPLFALGNAGVPGPTTITGQSTTGGTPGDAIVQAAGRSKAGGKLSELQIANAEVDLRRNLIDEQLMQSRLNAINVALTNRPGAVQDELPSPKLPPATGTMADVDSHKGKVEVMPQPTVTAQSGDNTSAAGKHVFWKEYKLSEGRTIHLPWSDEGPAEAAQAMLLWPLIYEKNKRKLWTDGRYPGDGAIKQYVLDLIGRTKRWHDGPLNAWYNHTSIHKGATTRPYRTKGYIQRGQRYSRPK